MNEQYDGVSHVDAVPKLSHSQRELINSVFDKQELNTQTPVATAKLEMLLTDHHDTVDKSNPNRLPFGSQIESTHSDNMYKLLRQRALDRNNGTQGILHPGIAHIAMEKLVDHGNMLAQTPQSNTQELNHHLQILGRSLHRYEEGMRNLHGYASHSRKVIFHPIPKNLQQDIANQAKAYLTKPDFTDNKNYYHMDELTRSLSSATRLKIHAIGSSTVYALKHASSFVPLFSHVIAHPAVRQDFHDFLDNYEKKSEGHFNVAASVRGSMMMSPLMSVKERIGLATKYGNNPMTIDIGRHGFSYKSPIGLVPRTIKEIIKHHESVTNTPWNETDIGKYFTSGNEPKTEDIHHRLVASRLLDPHSVYHITSKNSLVDFAALSRILTTEHPHYVGLAQSGSRTLGMYQPDDIHKTNLRYITQHDKPWESVYPDPLPLKLADQLVDHRIKLHKMSVAAGSSVGRI